MRAIHQALLWGSFFAHVLPPARSLEARPSPAPARPLGRAGGRPGVCVVTDVDDTLKSSGGLMLGPIALGGVDTSFARGSYYPGAVQFQLELALHDLGPSQAPHDVAILTARAVELLAFLAIGPDSPICAKFCAAARACGRPGAREWRVGDVLYGSVVEWIWQDRKGWRKIVNFGLLEQRRRAAGWSPEGGYVLCADNGWSERDEEAVAGISESGLLRAAFIHAVSDDWSAGPPALPPDRPTAQGAPVAYFRTYAGAALKAARLGMLGADALVRVCERTELEAAADAANVPPGSLNAELIRADLAEARAFAAALAAPLSPSPGKAAQRRQARAGRSDPDEEARDTLSVG